MKKRLLRRLLLNRKKQRACLSFYFLFCLFLIHLHCKYGFFSVCLQLGDFYLAILVKVWPPGSSVFPIPVQQSRCKCFLTCRVCARRPCWRSKTIKLFSFGKKFNSHAKIFLLFSPPTWPPRTYSIQIPVKMYSDSVFLNS